MSEIRQNIVTRDWVIIASERAKRPQDFKKTKPSEKIPEYQKDCPFCPGNEGSDLANETFRIGDKSSWKVRSIYNKFPALSPGKDPSRVHDGMDSMINGFGVHEVIVEHPRHDLTIPRMTDDDVCNIIRTYRSRYETLRKMKGVEAVTIFKNQGLGAGASLVHPHSQVVATPIVPPQSRGRIDSAMKYYDSTGECVFCKLLAEEMNKKIRIVRETENFVSFVPFAAAAPFVTWIFPKRHTPSFAGITDEEIRDLAINLKDSLGRIYYGLDNPDFNYTIRSMPVNGSGSDYLHWYLNVVPRISQPAGFELGSGIFINTSIPEQCAEFLRSVKLP